MKPDDENGVPEYVQISHQHWFVIAFSAFVIAFIIGSGVAASVYFSETTDEMVKSAQAFTPFGAGLIAIVTFLTVAWRGEMNRLQLAQQIRQNDANDEANFAKLLQEGAKLIADRDKLPQVIAGISTLEALIREPRGRFAVEAMDLLGDLLIENYGFQSLSRINRSVIRGLALGASLGLKSRVDGDFKRPISSAKYSGFWTTIRGLRSLSFTGGALSANPYSEMRESIKSLTQVRLIHATVALNNPKFLDCHFDNCKIEAASIPELRHHKFTRCDFSDAIIHRYPDTPLRDLNMKATRNFYSDGHEPRDQHGEPVGFIFLTHDELIDLEVRDANEIRD